MVVIRKKLKLNLYLTPLMAINCKRTRYLNVKTEAIGVLERNTSEFLFGLSIGKGFVNEIQNPKAIKKSVLKKK